MDNPVDNFVVRPLASTLSRRALTLSRPLATYARRTGMYVSSRVYGSLYAGFRSRSSLRLVASFIKILWIFFESDAVFRMVPHHKN